LPGLGAQPGSKKAWNVIAGKRLRLQPTLGPVLAITASMVLSAGVLHSRGWRTEAAQASSTLVDLRSAADFRAQFNADHGTARLVLLLSPT
jgi:hypothetical protein